MPDRGSYTGTVLYRLRYVTHTNAPISHIDWHLEALVFFYCPVMKAYS